MLRMHFACLSFGWLMASTCWGQTIPGAECRALLQKKSGSLELTNSAGTRLAVFAADTRPKLFARLSPDAARVAFVYEDDPHTIIVRDTAGHQTLVAAEPATASLDVGPPFGALMSLSWPTPAVIQVAHHSMRNSSVFTYQPISTAGSNGVEVPAGITLPSAGLATFDGEDCQMGAVLHDVVCKQNKDVMLAGEPVYSDPGYGSALASVSVGTSASSTLSGGGFAFNVAIGSVTRSGPNNTVSEVELKVTDPKGMWTQSFVQPGLSYPDAMEVPYAGTSFGFYVETVNDAQGLFNVYVAQARDDGYDIPIAWISETGTNATGATVGLLQHAGAGAAGSQSPRRLVAISPLKTANQTFDLKNWRVVDAAAVPVSERVTAIKANQGMLMLQTDHGYTVVSAYLSPTDSTQPTKPSLVVTPRFQLPLTLTPPGSTDAQPVADWSCAIFTN